MKGQAKEEFEKWLNKKDNSYYIAILLDIDYDVNKVPDSMKWGVIVDFFRSVGYYVNTDISPMTGNYEWYIHKLNPSIKDVVNERFAELIVESEAYQYVDEEEARQAAIDKACEILNERLKG